MSGGGSILVDGEVRAGMSVTNLFFRINDDLDDEHEIKATTNGFELNKQILGKEGIVTTGMRVGSHGALTIVEQKAENLKLFKTINNIEHSTTLSLSPTLEGAITFFLPSSLPTNDNEIFMSDRNGNMHTQSLDDLLAAVSVSNITMSNANGPNQILASGDIEIVSSGHILLKNLPRENPHVVGALYKNSYGALFVSDG